MSLRLASSALALALLAAPLAAGAQQMGKVPRIAYLSLTQADTARHGFRRGLGDAGYVEGQSVRVEYRQAGGDAETVAQLAVELVALKPDVMVTIGTVASQAAQRATRTIPIVSISGDPVGASLVTSLARPGGNVTGVAITTGDAELRSKQLELLKEAVPRVSRVAYIRNPSNPSSDPKRLPDRVEQQLGVKVMTFEVRTAAEFDTVLASIASASVSGLTTDGDPLTDGHYKQIVDFAIRHKLPGVYPRRTFVEGGGLMWYGPSVFEAGKRAAAYVDKILKGAKPADLPVEQPTKYELVINLKTAKALGLTIPPAVLARADEVIQ